MLFRKKVVPCRSRSVRHLTWKAKQLPLLKVLAKDKAHNVEGIIKSVEVVVVVEDTSKIRINRFFLRI
jgi:hypothetical protein